MRAIDRIRNIAVIGAGMMGHGIAISFAKAAYNVFLIDLNDELIKKGMDWIEGDLNFFTRHKLLSKKRAKEILNRIEGFTDFQDGVKNSHFVMEAVAEKLEVKKEVFKRLAEICPTNTILATNTSTFKVSEIASGMINRERVLGAHWVNPPHIIPLVEVVPSEHTSNESFEVTFELFRKIGKVPIRCKDIPGFINNRIQFAMVNEGLKLLEMGAANVEDIDNAIKYGFGIRALLYGPFRWFDFFGEAKQLLAVYEFLYEKTKDQTFMPSNLLKEQVQSGKIGFATGKGWYEYPGEFPETLDSKRSEMLLEIAKWFKKISFSI
jgi:3-hydroxybutyryl-CoA dehydrogenase